MAFADIRIQIVAFPDLCSPRFAGVGAEGSLGLEVFPSAQTEAGMIEIETLATLFARSLP